MAGADVLRDAETSGYYRCTITCDNGELYTNRPVAERRIETAPSQSTRSEDRPLPVALSYDIHGSRRAIGERCMENDLNILVFERIAWDAPQLL